VIVADLATLKVTTFYVNEPDRRRPAYLAANNERTKALYHQSVESGACRNENKKGTHGPATHGRLCKACRDAHTRTKAAKVKSERPFSRVRSST